MSKLNKTKQQIQEAAVKLFAYQGFGSTSIREIAEHGEINAALVSYHFKNKQGILESIMVDYFEQLLDLLESTPCRNNERFTQLTEAIDCLLRFQCANGEVSTIIQRELSVSTMLVREVLTTYIARIKAYFQQLLEQGIASGEFRCINVEVSLVQLFSSIFFPYFNPQIIREVFYLDPLSDDYVATYRGLLLSYCRKMLKTDE